MPRIYKGSDCTLKLLVPQCENAHIEVLKVVLYTDDPTKATEITGDKVSIDGKYVMVKIDPYSFDAMNDGVINFIVFGDNFTCERQSNYFVKSPTDYVGLISGELQDKEITITTNNSTTTITKDDGYLGIGEVKVHTELPMIGYSVSITENGHTYIEPEEGYEGIANIMINTNVTLQAKPLIPNGFQFHQSTWEEFDMGEYDWSLVYNWTGMFWYCNKLKRINNFPEEIKAYGSVGNMFFFCEKLEEVPYFDTSKIGDFGGMLCQCRSITEVPAYDTSNAICMDNMFQELYEITSLPVFDCHNLDTPYAQKLVDSYRKLEEVGGFIGIKNSFKIKNCPRLRKSGFENIVDGLYDFVYWKETPKDNQGTLTMSNNTGNDVNESAQAYDYIISKAISKGWNIIFE
jgi:hypothetical protein